MGMQTVYVRKIMFSNELFKTELPWIQWSNLTPTSVTQEVAEKTIKKVKPAMSQIRFFLFWFLNVLLLPRSQFWTACKK